VFSTAEQSLPENLPSDTLKKEFINVTTSLNLNDKNYIIYNYEVRNLHQYRQKILDNLIEIREEFKPHLVIGPSLNDYHQDHQVIANEMIRAYKNTSSIICYELPWNHTVFNTQLFVKLKKEHIQRKFELLKNYKSQIILKRPYFSEEFIFGWAKMRGLRVKSKYAEAYEVICWVI
ncbi:MAG: PIG-L deacetylase family protein, partial [Candidatus Odinarchaeia archaeon]